ncbi:IPT/TIG domain-containing protein, partial [Shewanella sp. S1-49-MNA-CIBAN-0167]
YTFTPTSTESGQVISIVGENLSAGTNVVINDQEIQLSILSSNSAQFIIPELALTSNIYLKNQYGTSEPSLLIITKN